MKFNRRTKIMLVVAGFLLASLGSAVATVALNKGKDAGQNVAFEKAGGPNVTLGESVEFTNENPYTTADRIYLEPWGNFTSNGDTEVRVEQMNGTWTNLSQLQVSNNELTVEINDKQRIDVQGDTETLNYKDMAVDDGNADFTYSGSSGQTTLTIYNLPANTQIAAEDRRNTKLLDVDTTDGSGTATFTMDNSKHTVHLTAGSSTAPSLSNPEPTGKLQQEAQQLNVTLSDGDFPYDNVDVTFDLDGSTVTTKTVTSNGTVTADISSQTLTGGTHTVDVTATDDYGNTDTLSYTFKVPANVSVFNETQPNQRITNVNLEVQFVGDDGTIVSKSTGTNGKVNMTGLPVETTFVVSVDNTSDFNRRRIFVDSIYEQQEIYLLHENITASPVLFELDDRTGRFTPGVSGAILQIERPMTKDFNGDGNDTTRFQIISGDRFDATQSYPATLEDDVRYRLRIRNDAGDERILGAYRVTGPASETLTVGQLSFDDDAEDNTVLTDASLVEVNNSRFVRIKYQDQANATTQLNVTVHEYGNKSNEILNQSFTGTYGTFSMTTSVPQAAPDNITYRVEIEATRNSETETFSQLVGAVPDLDDRLPVDSRALTWMGWIAVVSLMGLVVVFDDSLAALTGVAAAALMGIVGIISVPPIAIGVAGTIAVTYATVRRT